MKTTCRLVRKSDLEILIESGDKVAINAMIARKEEAREEALRLAEFNKNRNIEFAETEKSRAELLGRQLTILKAAI